MAKRITRLIGEIQRDPFAGIGKPEPLKGRPVRILVPPDR
jgi:toxin YoeB